MIRTKKLSAEYPNITLKQQSDGRLIPVEINGFKFPKGIESAIEEVVSWVKCGDPEDGIAGDKYLEKIYLDIEQEASMGEVSRKTLCAYADAIERGEMKEAIRSDSDRENFFLVKHAKALVRQWRLMMNIASVIAEKQQAFLKSGDLMDYNGCTYEGISAEIDYVSESTIRREIHCLRFTIGNQPPMHVEDLFVRGKMPRLMALVLRILDNDPNAGAPAVTRKLQKMGEDVSERLVGMVLSQIAKPRFKVARRAAAKAKLSNHVHGKQGALCSSPCHHC